MNRASTRGRNCNGFLTTLMIAFTFLVTGCAAVTPMAFQNDSDKVKPEGPAVYLMTLDLKNSYRTYYVPRMINLFVETTEGKEKKTLRFQPDEKASIERPDDYPGTSYLLRMELPQGDYVLRQVQAMSSRFPVNGQFIMPLHMPLRAQARGVYYLGRVEADVRERKDEEFRAGPVIPLIDQRTSGAASGTWDVQVADRISEDETRFRERFPALKDVPIEKAILPAFDRGAAQKWWEEH